VVWNKNIQKLKTRSWIDGYLEKLEVKSPKILMLGDGLGFDSVYFAQRGYQISYFEFPGYSERFAKKIFALNDVSPTIIADANNIPEEEFDFVICLDVLEHAPDPPLLIRNINNYLKARGKLIATVAFFRTGNLVGKYHLTHLKANRKYSGRLNIFKGNNFKLVDGKNSWKGAWSPIVLEKYLYQPFTDQKWDTKTIKLRLLGIIKYFFCGYILKGLPFFLSYKNLLCPR
jgi:SAM-dependent methyltransferase